MRRGIPTTALRYISAEFLKTLALTLIVVTALWVFVGALQLLRKQYMGPGEFLTVVPLLAIVTLAYTLPMAVLFGASVSYGRMSFENEIRAMEWNGIHFGWIALPAVVIALAASCLALCLTGNIVPMAKARMDGIVRKNLADTINRQFIKAAQEGQSLSMGRLSVSLESYDAATGTMTGLIIIQSGPVKVESTSSTPVERIEVLRRVDAPSARMVQGRVPGAWVFGADTTVAAFDHKYVSFIFNDGRLTEYDPKHNGMRVAGGAPPVAIDLSEDPKTEVEVDHLPLLAIPSFARSAADAPDRQSAWTEFYERLTLGISPLFFALLAVPMALVARWKHTLTSFLPSLLVVMMVYYPLHIWGKVLGRSGSLDPMWGMFMGNAAILVISALAIVKVARR